MTKTSRHILAVVMILTVALSGMAGAQTKKAGPGGAAEAHANKGVQLAQQGALDAAIAEFTEAIKISPKDGRLYRDRGGVFLTSKKFKEAADDFSKAIEIAPKDYAAYSARGAAMIELAQIDA